MTEFVAANIPIAFFDKHGCGWEDDIAAAAAYLSWIAYPRRDEVKRATRFTDAIRVIPFKAQGKHAPDDLRGIERAKMVGTYRDAMRAIGRRWPARWMAMKMMGMDERWPDGMSSGAAATLACDPDGTVSAEMGALIEDGEPKKVAERVWRDSLPALAMLIALPSPKNKKIEWLQKPEWVPDAVAFANEIGPDLSRKFRAKVMFLPQLTAVQS